MRSIKGALHLVISSFIFFLYASGISHSQTKQYDVLIKNTRIVDGTGKAAFKGNIAIKGEQIVAVGRVTGDADTVIDGAGLVTVPGFIDPHSHADMTIMEYPLAENLIMQGITTFLGGHCSISPAPKDNLSFGQWLSMVEEEGMSLNYAPLVGHNVIRELVMGEDFKRTARPDEIGQMKVYVDEAMESGAFGLSTFTDPSSGEYAALDEIIDLVEVAGKHGGKYYPHTRHIQSQWPSDDPDEYGYGIFHGPMEDVWVGMYRGIQEAIEISRRTGVPVHIAHLSNVYKTPQPHPDFLEEATARATLWVIDEAREEGLDVTFDVIISESSISVEQSLFREFVRSRNVALEWLNDLEKEEFAEKLKSERFRDKIREVYNRGRLKLGMIHTKADPYWFNCFKILSCQNGEYVGKTIGELAAVKNTDALSTLFDILVEDPGTKWVQFLDRRQSVPATVAFLEHPLTMPCTDVSAQPAEPDPSQLPPPIAYGLYPRYIAKYVREESVISLEEAIRKATSLPAELLGLDDRGVIASGNYADILVFDLDNIGYRGDFQNPAVRPDGIRYVMINGQIVYKDKAHTGIKPGKVLKRK